MSVRSVFCTAWWCVSQKCYSFRIRLHNTFPSTAKMIEDIPHLLVSVLHLQCHSLRDCTLTWILRLGKTLYWNTGFNLVYIVAPKIFTNREHSTRIFHNNSTEVWKEQERTRASQSGFSPKCSTPSDCSCAMAPAAIHLAPDPWTKGMGEL